MKFIKILPLLALISCGKPASDGNGQNDTIPSPDTVAVQDSVEEDDDTPDDPCFNIAPNDIKTFKEILDTDVTESTDSTVTFKMKGGLVGHILRTGGCDSNSSWQNMEFTISGFKGKDWKNIEGLKKLFLKQTQKLPWTFSDEVISFLKTKFTVESDNANAWRSEDSDKENDNVEISVSGNSAEMDYYWHEP